MRMTNGPSSSRYVLISLRNESNHLSNDYKLDFNDFGSFVLRGTLKKPVRESSDSTEPSVGASGPCVPIPLIVEELG